MNKKKCEDIAYDKGSGNIYADLGFEQPEIWTIKARIATRIFELIKEKELTQKQAGVLFGIAQGRVSDLK